MTADQREAWAERAAIMEYDGGLTRAAAEHAASRLMGVGAPNPAARLITEETASLPRPAAAFLRQVIQG